MSESSYERARTLEVRKRSAFRSATASGPTSTADSVAPSGVVTPIDLPLRLVCETREGCADTEHNLMVDLSGDASRSVARRDLRRLSKLAISTPGDDYEQEADRVADRMVAPPGLLSTSTTSPHIQRYVGHTTGQSKAAPASVDRVLADPGMPLDLNLRQDMEQRFGHDFARVRVHTGAVAEQSAQEVNARAYTVAHHIVFGTNKPALNTPSGQRLLAHELTHVVQQGAAPTARYCSEMPLTAVFQRHSQPTVCRDSLWGSITDRVGQAIDPATRQFGADLWTSMRQSPEHFAEFFTGELLDLVKANWPKIAVVTGALIGAELVIGALEAAPTGISQVIGAVLEVAVLAVLGYFAAVETVGAMQEGMRWFSIARHAAGDPKQIAEASRAFVRMVFHIFMAVLAVAGVRAKLRGGAIPRIKEKLGVNPKGEAPPQQLPPALEGEQKPPISSPAQTEIPEPPASKPAEAVQKVPGEEAPGRAPAAQVAFDAAKVADELVAATKSLSNAGQKMISATRQLSGMGNLTAAQKVEVMLEFFKRIGFAIGKAGVVDDGAQFVMYSEDSLYAFAFVKATGEILYGKFNVQTLQYVWSVVK